MGCKKLLNVVKFSSVFVLDLGAKKTCRWSVEFIYNIDVFVCVFLLRGAVGWGEWGGGGGAKLFVVDGGVL